MLPTPADSRIPHIDTARLRLRRWTMGDLSALAAINADPEVNRHLLGPLDRTTTRSMIQRIEAHFAVHGFGLWAIERRADGELLGYAGLQVVPFEAAFTPAIEAGWRLAASAWGHGYATEAARAAVDDGFDRLQNLDEVVAFTAHGNLRSEAVMQRTGMQRDVHADFDHPRLPPDSPLRPHRLYRLSRQRWADTAVHSTLTTATASPSGDGPMRD